MKLLLRVLALEGGSWTVCVKYVCMSMVHTSMNSSFRDSVGQTLSSYHVDEGYIRARQRARLHGCGSFQCTV